MKKNLTRALAFAVIFTVVLTAQTIWSFAAGNVITDTVLTPFISLGNTSPYTAVGGFSIGKKGSGSNTRNSMFVMVANSSTEASAEFYYYPNITNNPTNKKKFYINYAGHANAMAIDSKNIYVTGWVHNPDNLQSYNPYNNIILMIRRSKIALKTNGDTLIKDNLNTGVENDFAVLHPKKINPNATQQPNKPYVAFDCPIGAITVHGSKGHFIVAYHDIHDNNQRFFTTAELVEYNGSTLFVVSESNKFKVLDDYTIGPGEEKHRQDIYYDSNRGFYQSIYVSNSNGTSKKNYILRANIDSGSYYTQNGVKVYTPDKIIYNPSSSSYQTIEFESFAFDLNGDMLIACNAKNSSGSPADGVFKLTRSSGGLL